MLKILTSLLLMMVCAAALAATDRGWFGFTSSVDAEGVIWNPTLVSITVEGVVPGSPAALQNLVKGDQILQVDGKTVAGTKGAEIKAIVESKAPGDKLALRLKHPNGEISDATLVAQKKPGT